STRSSTAGTRTSGLISTSSSPTTISSSSWTASTRPPGNRRSTTGSARACAPSGWTSPPTMGSVSSSRIERSAGEPGPAVDGETGAVEAQVLVDAVRAVPDDGLAGAQDRRDGFVEDVRAATGPVAPGAGVEELEVRAREQVSGAGEGRDPLAVHTGVPADVVGVQVGAD